MPAGAIIGTVELVAPYLAYKFPGNRCWIIVVCQIGTIIAAVLLWQLDRGNRGGLLYACYTLACFGGSYAVLMGMQTANTAGYTKKSVTASGIFLGYCLGALSDIFNDKEHTDKCVGNFVGPLVFKPEDGEFVDSLRLHR